MNKKVVKIVAQKALKNLCELRAFLRIATYYRIQILRYTIVLASLYQLLKEGKTFAQTEKQQKAIDIIKKYLTTILALIYIDYYKGAREMIIAVNITSLDQIIIYIYKQLIRNVILPGTSLVYSQSLSKNITLESQNTVPLYSLLKFKRYLYNIKFTLETDANTLVTQLNYIATNIPAALIIRQLVQIYLQDFTIQHVSRKKIVQSIES